MIFEKFFHDMEIDKLYIDFPEYSRREISQNYHACRNNITSFLQGIQDRRMDSNYGVVLVNASKENVLDRLRHGLAMIQGRLLRLIYA